MQGTKTRTLIHTQEMDGNFSRAEAQVWLSSMLALKWQFQAAMWHRLVKNIKHTNTTGDGLCTSKAASPKQPSSV